MRLDTRVTFLDVDLKSNWRLFRQWQQLLRQHVHGFQLHPTCVKTQNCFRCLADTKQDDNWPPSPRSAFSMPPQCLSPPITKSLYRRREIDGGNSRCFQHERKDHPSRKYWFVMSKSPMLGVTWGSKEATRTRRPEPCANQVTTLGWGTLYHVEPRHVSLVTGPPSLPPKLFLYLFNFSPMNFSSNPFYLLCRTQHGSRDGPDWSKGWRKDKHTYKQKTWIWLYWALWWRNSSTQDAWCIYFM